MERKTIHTALSDNQLGEKIRAAYVDLMNSMSQFQRAQGPAKFKALESIFYYLGYIEAAAKKMTASVLKKTGEYSVAHANQTARFAFQNRKQIEEHIAKPLNDALANIDTLQQELESDMLKAKGLIRYLRSQKKQIKKLRKQSVNNALNKVRQTQDLPQQAANDNYRNQGRRAA